MKQTVTILVVFLALMAIAAYVDAQQNSAQIPKCYAGKVNVLFLLDASGSVGKPDFQILRDFTKSLASSFKVGPNKAQIGVMTFGRSTKTQFALGSKTTDAKVASAISAIRHYNGGNTNTHLALKQALTMLKADKRVETANFVVVITDGLSSSVAKTVSRAGELKKHPMTTVYAIGVGQAMMQAKASTELKNIATNNGTVKQISNIEDVSSKVNKINNQMCNAVVDEKILPACGALRVDLAFIVDKSGSVSAKHFQNNVKPFCRSIIRRFWVSGSGSQFAAVTYGNKAKVEFNFNSTMEKKSILKAIDNMQYPSRSENTYTNRGLDTARQLFTGPAVRPKSLTRQVYVVVTDGKSTKAALTKSAAKAVRDQGGIVIAVGIGGSNLKELKALAGPTGAYLRHTSMTNLGSIITRVTKIICGAVCK